MIQVLSSTEAERLPAMCGSETLAMLVSSTSINVASVTVRPITNGENFGFQVSDMAAYLTSTDGTTLIPGARRTSGSAGCSKTILTGTRWTTLTKFPVAFSGGIR